MIFYGGNFKDTRFLIGSYGTEWGFYLKNGQVVYGPSEPEFIDFIKTFRKWYQSGWIDPAVLINSRKAYSVTVENKRVGIYIDYVSNILNYGRLLKNTYSSAELIPLGNPRFNDTSPKPAGHNSGVFLPFASAYISTRADHPEKIIRMLDYAWSEEGRMLFNFGIEGESWEINNGKPVYLDKIFDSAMGTQSLKYYIVAGPYLKDPDSFMQSLKLQSQKDAIGLWCGEQPGIEKLPLLIPGRDQEFRLKEINNMLDSYVFKTATDIVSGKKKLSELGDFGENLKKIGLSEALSIYKQILK
ncbi:MAG: hypothetical protein U9N32_06130 [Spirochaetota bacterium]|nr:hypothetical protein [Spirochaetota bacterium]